MRLIETTITVDTLRMRFSGDVTLENSTESLTFEVPIATLLVGENNPLGDPGARSLAVIQRAALHHVRVVVTDEMQRLAAQAREFS
jgi:hypothetical protein